MSLIDTAETLLNNKGIAKEQRKAYIFSATAITLFSGKGLINEALGEVEKRNQ